MYPALDPPDDLSEEKIDDNDRSELESDVPILDKELPMLDRAERIVPPDLVETGEEGG